MSTVPDEWGDWLRVHGQAEVPERLADWSDAFDSTDDYDEPMTALRGECHWPVRGRGWEPMFPDVDGL